MLLLFAITFFKESPLTDLFTDIIKRCKRGDRKAQESVYNLLAGRMFAVCLRYSPNYDEARDLLHDGFVTVFTKIGQFHQEGSFEGWVRRIFVSHAMERYRNDAKSMIVNNMDEVERSYATSENEDDEEWGAYQLTEAELLSMVDELPPQYKVVFNLYVIDGLSHRDIAEKMGISEGTSRSNLLRARSILQKQINDQVDSMKVRSNASK
jgi:RNA polymerase sigma-70 factor (ECF subfamily)